MAVVDAQAGLFGVQAGDGDIAFGGIGADDIGAQPGHRFAEKPAAAADIQQAQALEGQGPCQVAVEFGGDLGGDIGQTAGVHLVQRFELARRIPPFGGHRLKLCHFGGVYGGLHGVSLRLRRAAMAFDSGVPGVI